MRKVFIVDGWFYPSFIPVNTGLCLMTDVVLADCCNILEGVWTAPRDPRATATGSYVQHNANPACSSITTHEHHHHNTAQIQHAAALQHMSTATSDQDKTDSSVVKCSCVIIPGTRYLVHLTCAVMRHVYASYTYYRYVQRIYTRLVPSSSRPVEVQQDTYTKCIADLFSYYPLV